MAKFRYRSTPGLTDTFSEVHNVIERNLKRADKEFNRAQEYADREWRRAINEWKTASRELKKLDTEWERADREWKRTIIERQNTDMECERAHIECEIGDRGEARECKRPDREWKTAEIQLQRPQTASSSEAGVRSLIPIRRPNSMVIERQKVDMECERADRGEARECKRPDGEWKTEEIQLQRPQTASSSEAGVRSLIHIRRPNSMVVSSNHSIPPDGKSGALGDTKKRRIVKLEGDCGICYEKLKFVNPSPPKEVMSTQCGHLFCKSCIEPELTRSNICPKCGREQHVRNLQPLLFWNKSLTTNFRPVVKM